MRSISSVLMVASAPLVALVFCLSAAAPRFAFAQTKLAETAIVDATEPTRILEIAQRYGAASMSADDDGAPLILGEVDGVSYSVFFYRCDGGRDCRNIRFYAGWAYKGASLSDVNIFNRDKRFGTAYIDTQGDLNVEFNVNVDFGVSEANLIDTFDWWRVILRTFKDYFGLSSR